MIRPLIHMVPQGDHVSDSVSERLNGLSEFVFFDSSGSQSQVAAWRSGLMGYTSTMYPGCSCPKPQTLKQS